MVSPVHGEYRRCQAEIPLIVLCRFPGPALASLNFQQACILQLFCLGGYCRVRAVLNRLCPTRIVRRSQIHESGRQVLSRHLVVVAGRAGPFERIAEADGIDVGYIAQPELPEHEEVCPTRHGGAKLFLIASAAFFP